MKKNLRLKILLGSLLVAPLISAQEIALKGIVTDILNGEPLPGVTVLIKGTKTGTITNIDGTFSLKAPDKTAVITFSYIGYTSQEIVVGNQTSINIALSLDTKQLSEVVVVGYSEKDQRKLTSSIATVNSDQIEQVPMSTFDNILQGRAPGVLVQSGNGQPGRAAEITIRGIKSITSNSTPLYILDGIQITTGDFATINPNDIASVSILKDAAATQVYGSRGATGVIVITSKSGKKGKTKVEYHTFFGVSPAPKYNSGILPLTSAQLIDLQQEVGIGATNGLPQEQLDSLKKN